MTPNAQTLPILQTNRLALRGFRLEDGLRVRELAGERAIAENTSCVPHPYLEGMVEEWISSHRPSFEKGEGASWAVVLKETSDLVGAVSLASSPAHRRAEMGYWMGVGYWNRGYCTEAAEAVLKHGFEKMGMNKITALHYARNPASGKVLQKIGMKREGLHREHILKWGEYVDTVSYGILRSEWPASFHRQ